MTDNLLSSVKVFHCPTFLLLNILLTICHTCVAKWNPPLSYSDILLSLPRNHFPSDYVLLLSDLSNKLD